MEDNKKPYVPPTMDEVTLKKATDLLCSSDPVCDEYNSEFD